MAPWRHPTGHLIATPGDLCQLAAACRGVVLRVVTRTAISPAVSDISLKVGPHGFIHNWIFVGIPTYGQHVHHSRFGPGTVDHATDHHVHVQFASGHHHVFPVVQDPQQARRLEQMSDDDIYKHMMARGEGHHFDLGVAELNRRDQADSEARIKALYDERPKTDEDRERVYKSLTDLGENPEDAWAHAHAAAGDSHADAVRKTRVKAVIDQLRGQGYSGAGFDELARKAWKDDVQRRALHAEAETNGYLTNHEGTRKGIDGWNLFTGPESAARRYASPELKEYWDKHGRPTFDGFRDELLNGQGRKRIGEDFLK